MERTKTLVRNSTLAAVTLFRKVCPTPLIGTTATHSGSYDLLGRGDVSSVGRSYQLGS